MVQIIRNQISDHDASRKGLDIKIKDGRLLGQIRGDEKKRMIKELEKNQNI